MPIPLESGTGRGQCKYVLHTQEEQQDVAAFLERLRFANDKAEFDQFMTERRPRPPASPPAGEPQPQQG